MPYNYYRRMDIAKADESLKAAEHCYSEGLNNSSVSRAYYSMYQAAQTALEAAGIRRAEWTHAGLQATFANELTRRRKLYSAFRVRYPAFPPACVYGEAIESCHAGAYSRGSPIDGYLSQKRPVA